MCDLFLTLSFVNITDLKCVLYQGDDVTIIAKDVVFAPIPEIAKYFKLESAQVGTAVGFLVHNSLSVDLVQMAIKIMNRSYPSGNKLQLPEKLAEYQVAVRDRLSLIKNYDEYIRMIEYNSLHYSISTAQSEILADFCFSFARVTTEYLQESMVELEIMDLHL